MERLSKILVVTGNILLILFKVAWGLVRLTMYIGAVILSFCASIAMAGGAAGMMDEE